MSSLSRRDAVLALLVVVIWGAHFAVIKAGVAEMDPLVALSLRFGLTGLAFLPFARRLDRKTLLKMAEIGFLIGVCHQGLLFFGLQFLDSASVAVLMQSQTVFAVLLGWWLLGERFGWRTSAGLAVAGTGLVVMLGVPDIAASPLGFGLILLSSLTLSFAYIRMRQLAKTHAATFIAVTNLSSIPVVAALSLMVGGTAVWTDLGQANHMLILGVLAYQVCVVSLSHIWWQQLLSRNEVAKVTCFSLLMPVVAIAIAVLFLGQTPSWTLLGGAGLITLGLAVIVVRRMALRRDRPTTMVE